MKKLNITKKQYDESKYFNKKYGSLKFMSESGNLYKTDKGVIIALESEKKEDDDEEPKGDDEEPKGGDEKGNGEEELTVKKEDLASALQGVIDTVKDIAADNDVVLPEEEEDDEEKGDDDSPTDKLEKIEGEFEFDEGDDDVCPTCGQKRGCCKTECGPATECGGKKPSLESVRKRRAIRESIAKKLRARKMHESVMKRIRARKVLESIRRRRALKRMMESRKARAEKPIRKESTLRFRRVK